MNYWKCRLFLRYWIRLKGKSNFFIFSTLIWWKLDNKLQSSTVKIYSYYDTQLIYFISILQQIQKEHVSVLTLNEGNSIFSKDSEEFFNKKNRKMVLYNF